jgi:GNAT superfamily N-acetyltransferase
VLAGTSGGAILTDDPQAPSWAAVHELSDDGTLFLAGALSQALVAEVIERLRRERVVVLGLAPDDPLLPLLPPDPDYDGADIDFEDRDPAVDLERLSVPPLGLRLARIDRELAQRCTWPPWMGAGIEAALAHGVGYCLLDGELVVSEAFAGPLVDGALEMGTITHADYRRRGLGTVVCAHTILECERLGYVTWWNTATTNASSAGLARKLGYRSERQYRVLAWYPPRPG